MGRPKKTENMKVEKTETIPDNTKSEKTPEVKLSGSILRINVRFDKKEYKAGDKAPDGLIKWIDKAGIDKSKYIG